MPKRSVFITGAASGIGLATAERFAAEGYFVGAVDRDEAGLKALKGKLGPCFTMAADVTDAGSLSAALDAFFSAAGRLDVLVNNAGVIASGDFETIPLAKHQQILDVNFKGVVNGCHLAFPYLKKTGGARVINLASASAAYGMPGLATYSATKFAVRGLTEALNQEWARHDIYVAAIWPIYVNTAMVRNDTPESAEKLGIHLQPEDIASVVYQAATRPKWLAPVHTPVGMGSWLVTYFVRFAPHQLSQTVTKILSGY